MRCKCVFAHPLIRAFAQMRFYAITLHFSFCQHRVLSFPPTKSGAVYALLPAVLCSQSLIVKWFDVVLYPPPAGSIPFRRRLDTALQNAFPIWLSSAPKTDRPYPVLLRKKLPEYLSGLRHRQPILQRAYSLSQACTVYWRF